MYADSVLTAILQAENLDSSQKIHPAATKLDRMHFKECLIEMLQDMFGEDSVPKIFKGEKLYVSVDGKKANIDLLNLVSFCLGELVTWHVQYETQNNHDKFFLHPLNTLFLQEVSCDEDETFQQIIQTAVTKLHQSLAPAHM